MTEAKQTKGQQRVRITFNPSSNILVDRLKLETAELIDLCENRRNHQETISQEESRLWSLAQTAYEEAAMWAVKAATL